MIKIIIINDINHIYQLSFCGYLMVSGRKVGQKWMLLDLPAWHGEASIPSSRRLQAKYKSDRVSNSCIFCLTRTEEKTQEEKKNIFLSRLHFYTFQMCIFQLIVLNIVLSITPRLGHIFFLDFDHFLMNKLYYQRWLAKWVCI